MNREIKRAALYARVSTDTQNAGIQLDELREYAARRGWAVKEFVDVGISGSKESRPQLNQLMGAVNRQEFDAVLVWKLDRLGRSLRHLVNTLAELESLGVAFISLRDSLDLTTPSGQLQFAIIGAMAQFERSLIQERVKAGMQRAKRNGRPIGRKPSAVNRAAVLRLRSEGKSLSQVAATYGISRALVSKIVKTASR